MFLRARARSVAVAVTGEAGLAAFFFAACLAMGGLLGSGKLAEHVLGRGHAEIAGRLDVYDAGDAVLGVQGKALGAHAQAEGTFVPFPPPPARQLAVAVGQQPPAFGW